MNVFFTSDTHFAHANIIKYCRRPFSSVEEMDETIVDAWNSVVSDDDIVVHVGDLTLVNRFANHPRVDDVIKRLKGVKVLVRGNHDGKKAVVTLTGDGWIVVSNLKFDNVKICHFPPEVPQEGVAYVHGHSHGTCNKPQCVDVGVDVLGYVPKQIEHVVELCAVHVPVDGVALKKSIIRFVAEKKCKWVIPNTFIICGEGEQQDRCFCSSLCQKVGSFS